MNPRRIGAVVVAIMLAVAAFGPLAAPYRPDAWIAAPFQPPSGAHWLGTDDMGADLWSAWLYGARHSVLIALLAALGATALGTLVGAAAGYLRGRWDFIAMRVVDFHLTLPTLPLVLIVAFYAGPNRAVLIAVLIFASWARAAREIYPQAAALRDADFVVAERAMGATEIGIVVRQIIPALRPMILAQFARLAHNAVLMESSLSFLGLGDPQWASWGGTLYYANARAAFLADSWLWWVLPPGLGIGILVTGFALLGVGKPRGAALRAAMVPHGPQPENDARDLLNVVDLHVGYDGLAVLQGVDLHLVEGELLGLVGISGAGKTTLVQTILGLLPQAEISRGAVWFHGRELLRAPEEIRRRQRGSQIAWIPQAAMQSLNPVRSIGSQLREVARLDGDRGGVEAAIDDALLQVGLSDEVKRVYAHQLSGGMRQRVAIAMMLCRRPRVLLADEPTSGLDVERATEILDLLTRLCRERNMALLLISHDLALLERHCDRLAILDGGRIVESGATDVLLRAPRSAAGRTLTATAHPSSRFALPRPPLGEPVLELEEVDFSYSAAPVLTAVSMRVHAGESVGLVGASGAGKTTIARLALRLLKPKRGTVRLLGQDFAGLRGAALRAHLRQAHLIFQDPFSALSRHQRVRTIVAEPLRLAGVDGRTRRAAVMIALAEAGLVPPEKYVERSVDSLSGGERQRVALARALIAGPRLIVADEPTSMLDAAVKWAWLERLDALRKERGLAVLLITHDRAQGNAFCDRIITLEEGRASEGEASLPISVSSAVP
jgi:ABC-type glutathione transport system ATPase component/ABC-type dipeptide/oligopeptide/nickel transport system permease subunit